MSEAKQGTKAQVAEFCAGVDFDLLTRFDKNERLSSEDMQKVAVACASPVPVKNDKGQLDIMRNPIYDLSAEEILKLYNGTGFADAGYSEAAAKYIKGLILLKKEEVA